MSGRFRQAVAPAYLFLALLIGGSPQGVWGSALLQLLAVALIAWALIERREQSLPPLAWPLIVIVTLALLLGAIQLVPLPVGTWTSLPGRQFVVRGFELLGIRAGAQPISLAPYDTLGTLLTLLPPLGMLAATLSLRAFSTTWLAIALIAGAMAGVLLGILQVSSPMPEASPWYLYRISNFGVATGFFANSNHMASLLLVTMPFLAAVGARLREQSTDARKSFAGVAVASGGLVVAILGLILNQSLAGLGLGVPVLLASLLILFGPTGAWTRRALAAIAVAGLAAIALLWASPIGSRFDDLGASTSITSRREIAANGVALASDFGPVGTGLGSFAKLYSLSEDPAKVDRYYVNHAHNDYLELAVETGAAGLILILLFLIWWTAATWRMLRSPASDQFALAAAVASAAILLHSAVDYPLRTAAIGSVFAMCLALLLLSRRVVRGEKDLRPARHLVVG